MDAASQHRLPAEPATGAPLAAPTSAEARSDPGGFSHVLPLDGIRGFAVMLTVANHLLLTNTHPSVFITILTSVRISTWLGVDLFLALSGFLITGILFDSLHSRHYLRNFYGRRALRILPLYYLALVALGLLSFPLHMHWNGFGWVLATFLQNTPLWFNRAVPYPLEPLTGHLWTIALEEQFYLFWPMLVVLVRDRRRLMTVALALSVVALGLRIAIVAHGGSAQYTYKMLPCRMDGLLLGAWLALAFRGPLRARLIKWSSFLFFPLGAILFVEACHEHGLDWRTSAFVNSIGYTLSALASAALIAMTFHLGGLARRIFIHPCLRWLGRYSYGIYVWHLIFAGFVIAPTRHLVARITPGKGIQMLAGALTGTAASLLLGYISYHAYEVHFLRLKRFFAYRG